MAEPSSTKKNSRFARFYSAASIVMGQLNTAIVIAGSFVVTPFVLHGLGDSAYGGWLLINSFIGYMKMLDLGATTGTVKFGAGAQARGDSEDLARVMNTSAAMFFGVASITVVVSAILALMLPRVYPGAIAGASGTILILGGAMAIDLAFRPFAAALRMRSLHFVYDASESVCYLTFRIALVIYFAHLSRLDYRLLALLALAETVFRIVFIAAAALWLNPAVRKMNPFRPARGMFNKLATMGFAVSLLNIADIVRFQIDAAVIGYMMPQRPEAIAIFGVGTRLTSIAYHVIGVISSVLMPRFSGLHETENKAGVADLLRKANLLTGLAAVFLLVNLAVVGPQFLQLWLGKPWIPQSSRIMLLLIPAYFVVAISLPSATMIFARGRLRSLTMLNLAEAFANAVLSIALVRPFGLLGVAFGTAIPLVFFRAILFPALLRKEAGITPSEYWRQHLTTFLVGITYLVLVGGLSLVTFESYLAFFGVCVGSTIVFAALLLAFVPTVRDMVRRRILRRT